MISSMTKAVPAEDPQPTQAHRLSTPRRPGPGSRAEIETAVVGALASQPVIDVHTHLYPIDFFRASDGATDGALLYGIDELLTYHYLVAEAFRVVPASRLDYEAFWRMPKSKQADHIWQHLFVERTPVSEACRGVITTLSRLGLDPQAKDLRAYREWYATQPAGALVDRVFTLAGIESVAMTNNVFDDRERQAWQGGVRPDPRFTATLRLDPLVLELAASARRLAEWGYDVGLAETPAEQEQGRRFLHDWIERTGAVYCAVSLPPEFRFPAEGEIARVLERIVAPVCSERRLPLAMMIGAVRGVNPRLKEAGDALGAASVAAVASLCDAFPQAKFMVTMLARENQHELAVTARKFDNLMVFGCWWFLNTPSLVEEITRMRLELLGCSFIPQHSDARVLEQLIYKWEHARQVIGRVLADAYAKLLDAGLAVGPQQIERDVRALLHDNFTEFLSR